MVLAVDQRHFEIDHGLAQRAFLQIVDQPFLDGGDKVAWHDAPHDPVDEPEARAPRQRPDLDLDVGELAVASRLALVARMLRGACLDRLTIGDPWCLGVHGDIVAAGEPVDRDLEMHLALAAQQQLVRLGPHLEGERRILFDDLLQRARELHLVVAVACPEGLREHRRIGRGKVARRRDARR